jgi:hypothetical protein
MRCYFLRKGHIASVETLTGLSDEEAIAKAHHLFSQRQDRFEGFEVWDSERVVFRHPDPDGDSTDLLGLDTRPSANPTGLLAQSPADSTPDPADRSGAEWKGAMSIRIERPFTS